VGWIQFRAERDCNGKFNCNSKFNCAGNGKFNDKFNDNSNCDDNGKFNCDGEPGKVEGAAGWGGGV
jgi:hypothetical protein